MMVNQNKNDGKLMQKLGGFAEYVQPHGVDCYRCRLSTACHAIEALQLTSLLASDVAKWLGSLNVAGAAPG